MPTFADFVGGFGGGLETALGLVITLLVAGFVLIVLIAVPLIIWQRKKKWNLKVEFKLPRSDGRIVNAEWGKGQLDNSKGVVILKRKGMTAVAMKPFDIKRYLQGGSILTVIQTSPDDYVPALPESFLEVRDDETGEEGLILDMVVDSGASKAWKASFLHDAELAFTLKSFFEKYQGYFAFGFILISIFVGFAILWSKV